MHNNQTNTLEKAAIHHLEILSSFLISDPDIIDIMSIEEVTEELYEMGVDPKKFDVFPVRSDRSTTCNENPVIKAMVKALFEAAKEEIFEEGVENEFSIGLISLIREYGNESVRILANHIIDSRVNEEIASEALRSLGRLDHPESYDERLRLLINSLNHPSARIRDAASVGLATLGDPLAIRSLKQAIQKEACVELREDMQQILESLESA